MSQLRVALTGSIGMGKSTTANMFRDAGVPVWDADAAVARLYAPGADGAVALARIIPDAVGPEGVDRCKLKSEIQADAGLLTKIEQVIHPLVQRDREAFRQAHSSAAILLFDIPLLFETKTEGAFDKIIVVSVPPDIQEERVLARGTMTKEQFEMIRDRQVPDHIKRAKADYVIETLSFDSAQERVHSIMNALELEISGMDATDNA